MALSGGRLAGSLYILQDRHAEALVGVFMALFSILPVFTGLRIGRWMDRVGSARVMRLGIVLVAAGVVLPLIWLNLPAIFICASLIGLGFNMVGIGAQHTVGNLDATMTSSQRLANFGWYALGHSVSSTLGPFLVGVMIDWHGFKAAFALLSLFTLMSMVLIYLKASSIPGTGPIVQPKVEDEAKTSGKDLLANPELRRIYGVNVITAAAWDFFIMVVPVLGVRFGFSASVIGTILSMFAVGTFTARLMTPWMARHFTEWRILSSALVIVAVVFAVMPWAKVPVFMMIAAFAIGLALGTGQPNVLSLLHTHSPAGRGGEAVGLRSLITNAVSVVTPVVFGVAIAAFSIATLLWASSAAIAASNWPALRRANQSSS